MPHNDQTPSLSSVYVWLHLRAEYLRKKERETAAAGETLESDAATAVQSEQRKNERAEQQECTLK